MSVKVLTNLSTYKLPSVYQNYSKNSFLKPKLNIKKPVNVRYNVRGKVTNLAKCFTVRATKEQLRKCIEKKVEKLEQCLQKLCGTITLYKDFCQIYKNEGKCPLCLKQKKGLDKLLVAKIERLAVWIKKGKLYSEKEKLSKEAGEERESETSAFLTDCMNLNLSEYKSVLQGKRETFLCLKEAVLKRKVCNICDDTVQHQDIPGILSQIDRHVCSLYIHS